MADHEQRQWFFAAFSTRDGREIWRVLEDKVEEAYGWSTPFVWENASRTEIVTVANNRVRAYDPSGKRLWELKGLSLSTSPTPFAADGLLYVSSGYPADPFRPVYVIRPGASGDISLKEGETTNEYVVWHQRAAGTYMASPLVYGDYLYSVYSQGFITCHEAKTGKPVYGRQRIALDAAAFTASPWAYNGKVFAASEDGDVYVIQAGPEYKLLHKNTLGEMMLATPAVLRGSLIIRTVSSLWRIAKTQSH
jgi:outer membrane protein assembly factor BamB